MIGNRRTHWRPRIDTPEQGAEWLARWRSTAFTAAGALPAQPWRSATPRALLDTAEALLKVRARYSFEPGGERP